MKNACGMTHLLSMLSSFVVFKSLRTRNHFSLLDCVCVCICTLLLFTVRGCETCILKRNGDLCYCSNVLLCKIGPKNKSNLNKCLHVGNSR